jgi:SAM-dependent MidA family methyltransferase
VDALAAGLAERIRREGAIPFDCFVDAALSSEEGFFGSGRGAGRAGRDFVTAPEVGPLFGVLVARAIDGWWDDLGRPDPFVVVDAGAGRGRLAADVLAAGPRCAPALRLVLAERSPALRAAQHELLALEPPEDALGPAIAVPEDDDLVLLPVPGTGPITTSLPDLPAVEFTGVVLANELLDNLPFRVVERGVDGWLEVRVGLEGERFVEVLVPAAPALASEAARVAGDAGSSGDRFPVPAGVAEWLDACATRLRRGFLVVVDYAATAAELARRGERRWLRTYRAHAPGTSPLVAPGSQDITVDLPFEYVVHAAERVGLTLARHVTQAEWLRELGLDALVDEARAQWRARAHVGDLEAVRHRSRIGEAEALVDADGLGAHQVLVFRR